VACPGGCRLYVITGFVGVIIEMEIGWSEVMVKLINYFPCNCHNTDIGGSCDDHVTSVCSVCI